MNRFLVLSTEAARIPLQRLPRATGKWRSKGERLWRLKLAGLLETKRLRQVIS